MFTQKYKFSRSVGLISALLLIGVGVLFVFVTRAELGETSPIQVTMTSTPSVDNQITYYVNVTNISDGLLEDVKLSVPLPKFDTAYLSLGVTRQENPDQINQDIARPDNIGKSTQCGSTAYNTVGWPGSAINPDVGCPHWSWKMDSVPAGTTHVFSFTVVLKEAKMPYSTPLTWKNNAVIQIFGDAYVGKIPRGYVFTLKKTESNNHYVICTPGVGLRFTQCSPSAGQ